MSTNPRAGAPVNVVNAPTEEVQEILHVKPLRSGDSAAFTTTQEVEEIDVLTKTDFLVTPIKVQQPTLGPLVNLQGDWTGRGLNVMSLPNNFKANPDNPFRVKINSLIEDTQFSPISAPIPNRGNTQEDIFFLGLTYLQKVSDEETLEGIHIEPGIFLFLPANSEQKEETIVRMATIPHGDSVMAQGSFFTSPGAPVFAKADPTPFTLDKNGKRVNITDANYLKAFAQATAPPRIPKNALSDPNLVLQQFNDNLIASRQKIVSTTVFQVNASPIGGIADAPGFSPTPGINNGGITNIPFVVKNADANSMSAIFWINTVENEDKSQFLVLQYSQTVILRFSVPEDPQQPNGEMVDIMWPHITVANLIKR
ncbi:heme-binding protein [Chitinophaga sp. RAB17]|uniref:heme-binding protein n=1 Tax=Chitinophaga sp. RAB17 TaxID=3233049 RepID=UPI003F905318